MDMTQIIGLVAGTCTSLAAAPQLIKAWKTKEVKDISLKMFLLFVVGISLWLLYGVLKSDLPIIITNSISLAFNGAMLTLKLKYKDKPADAKQPELA
jgi:MtN3 and saliva related transmembrane protein